VPGTGSAQACSLQATRRASPSSANPTQPPGVYVATPRRPNPPQKRIMERGLVCFGVLFINLIDQGGFGDDQGKIDDMGLVDAMVRRPVKPKARPSDMTFLAEELRFNLTLSA
jgi:hypothetical protein